MMHRTPAGRCANGTWIAVAFMLLAIAPGSARAQVCGDLDGNGIDVIDASNVCRAAVGLGSACTPVPELCDVNGSGSTDVIDCANVARLAVGLAGATDCPIVDELAESVATVVEEVEETLGFAFGNIPGSGGSLVRAEGFQTSQPCSDGGERRFSSSGVEFDQCQEGSVTINGSILISGGDLIFDVDITDEDGTSMLDGTVDASDGTADGTLMFSAPVVGDFAITFEDVSLELSEFNTPMFGSITFDGNIDGVTSVVATFDGTQFIDLVVTLEEGGTESFTFDVVTDELTENE